jgi:hypothetical protein
MIFLKLILEKLINKLTLKYSEHISGNIKGRVALFYIVHPVLLPKKMRNRSRFSNDGIAQNIPRALNELGYVVDIIHYQNTKWIPKRTYDFVIIHGGSAAQKIYPRLPTKTKRIYFATGRYWKDANIAIAKRMLDFTVNTGYLLPPERNIIDNEEYAVKYSDAVICLGNATLGEEYKTHNNNVFYLNNGVFPLHRNQNPKIKNGFNILFLAGRGNIHKGLDLLLDSFSKNREFTLHVCQHIDSGFRNVVSERFDNCNNIVVHNFVKMRSHQFEEIAESCSYSILPTCSEGQPGSTLECMLYGLVPIIPKEANIDFNSFAIPLDSIDSSGIEKALHKIKNLSDEEYSMRSCKAIECCNNEYSEESFKTRFKESIVSILNEN